MNYILYMNKRFNLSFEWLYTHINPEMMFLMIFANDFFDKINIVKFNRISLNEMKQKLGSCKLNLIVNSGFNMH